MEITFPRASDKVNGEATHGTALAHGGNEVAGPLLQGIASGVGKFGNHRREICVRSMLASHPGYSTRHYDMDRPLDWGSIFSTFVF